MTDLTTTEIQREALEELEALGRPRAELGLRLRNVLDSDSLETLEKLVLCYCLGLQEKSQTHPTDPFWVNYLEIGKACSVSARTAHEKIKSLDSKGFIGIHKPTKENMTQGIRRIWLTSKVLVFKAPF